MRRIICTISCIYSQLAFCQAIIDGGGYINDIYIGRGLYNKYTIYRVSIFNIVYLDVTWAATLCSVLAGIFLAAANQLQRFMEVLLRTITKLLIQSQEKGQPRRIWLPFSNHCAHYQLHIAKTRKLRIGWKF